MAKKRKYSRKSNRRRVRRLVVVLCALLVMLASLIYMIHYETTRREILRRNAEFSALYTAPTLAPTQVPTSTSTPEASPEPAHSPEPTPEPERTSTPSPTPEPTPTPVLDFEVALDVTRAPLATADADTLVFAMETPPPAQDAFGDLLAINPEAVAFLTIEDVLTLPVAQRPNDNDFYLEHSFDMAESIGGTLFLDGSNLLVPEDDCLIVYGHNMKNGTMFHPLINYEDQSFAEAHSRIRFDTLYENRVYAPFAALTVTADPGSERYLELRQFTYDEPGFYRFVKSLRALSIWDSPLDVAYGDHILLLVTCEYTHDNGRFVLALRAQRDGETWDVP